MNLFSGNATACNSLGNRTVIACHAFIVECDRSADDLQKICLAVCIPLILIALFYGVKGTGNLIVGSKMLLADCHCRDAEMQLFSERAKERPFWSALRYPYRYYNKTMMVSWQFFSGLKDYAVASLPFVLALLLLNAPKAMSSQFCHRVNCPNVSKDAQDGCVWAEAWLVQVIQSLFHERLG